MGPGRPSGSLRPTSIASGLPQVPLLTRCHAIVDCRSNRQLASLRLLWARSDLRRPEAAGYAPRTFLGWTGGPLLPSSLSVRCAVLISVDRCVLGSYDFVNGISINRRPRRVVSRFLLRGSPERGIQKGSVPDRDTWLGSVDRRKVGHRWRHNDTNGFRPRALANLVLHEPCTRSTFNSLLWRRT